MTGHCSGAQHIGLPTANFEKTISFYENLGFQRAFSTQNNGKLVTFLKLGDLVIEVYERDCAAGKSGAIDHFALNVDDVDAVYRQAAEQGLELLDDQVRFLPFWENGVRFFTILGPNGEKVEFSTIL